MCWVGTSDTGGTGQSPGVNVHEEQSDKASIVAADEGQLTAGRKDLERCPFNVCAFHSTVLCIKVFYSRGGSHAAVEPSTLSQ